MSTDPRSAARRAIGVALGKLERDVSRGAEVTKVAKDLERLRTKNHFGDMIEASMRPVRGAQK